MVFVGGNFYPWVSTKSEIKFNWKRLIKFYCITTFKYLEIPWRAYFLSRNAFKFFSLALLSRQWVDCSAIEHKAGNSNFINGSSTQFHNGTNFLNPSGQRRYKVLKMCKSRNLIVYFYFKFRFSEITRLLSRLNKEIATVLNSIYFYVDIVKKIILNSFEVLCAFLIYCCIFYYFM